jgi:hypothetical protein
VRRCRVCGCTDVTPCIDALGQPCAWVGPDLCSACEEAGQDEPLVELCTEGQASAFIRAMRQADAGVARARSRVDAAFERYLSAGGGA